MAEPPPGQDLPLGDAVLHVQLDLDPRYEDQLNAWFDEEHVPERLECPGFLWARRYVRVDGPGRKYLHVYGLEDVAALQTEEYRRVVPSSRRRQLFPPESVVPDISSYRNITRILPRGYRVDAER